MRHRLLVTALWLGGMAVTLGCGPQVENKPNFEPKPPPTLPKAAGGEGRGATTSSATPGG
jgi:hypothetical protein